MENEQKSTNNKNLIIGIGVVAVIAVVAILFLFVFKGNGNIAGSYKLVEMTEGSQTYSGSQLEAMESLMGKSVGLELKADKTGTLEVFGKKIEITYDDKNVIANGSPCPYTVNGNRITLEQSGTKMVFEKK